jgi:hypothetical protein
MDKAKRARTAETPKQPSPGLKLRAPYLYPDKVRICEGLGVPDRMSSLHGDTACSR